MGDKIVENYRKLIKTLYLILRKILKNQNTVLGNPWIFLKLIHGLLIIKSFVLWLQNESSDMSEARHGGICF
jgi:hypothetical protein